jgi:DNA damage-inducible protein 1
MRCVVCAQVNGVPVKAFVDSGAQMTIMTQNFAAKCHLSRLMDTRFAGMAVGVGSSRILGRIHQTPLKVCSSKGCFLYAELRLVVKQQDVASSLASPGGMFAATLPQQLW